VAVGVAHRRSGAPRGAGADHLAGPGRTPDEPVPVPVDARAFWRYSLLRGIGTACSLSLTWSDVLLVAVLASPEAAGIYAAASRFATSGQLGLQAMRLGIGPQLSAAFARGLHERAQVLYSVTTRWSVLLSWPIFLTLALFAEVVLDWFGPGFDAGATSLRILCAAMMFSVAVGNVGTLLLMSGHSGWAARNTAVALAVNIAANLLLIPWVGAAGAAIAWLAGVVVENGLGLLLIRRRLHIAGHGRTFALTAGATTVAVVAPGLLLLAWLGQSTAALLISVTVAGAILLLYMVTARRALHLDLVLGRRMPARTGDVAP
jgi:O-antigen/teichoic acid export membrane protein